MKTSIIVATYNGSKYIQEQLSSILAQTHRADEVLIFDDRSTDTTPQKIQNFIAMHHLEKSWHFYINSTNKGFVRNFLEGAQQAKGDIIFFCDQDDIWEPEKLAVLSEVMKRQYADAVYCLANTIDNQGQVIKNRLEKFHKTSTSQFAKQISLQDRLKSGSSSGLCLAFHKRILEEVTSISLKYQLPHDLPVGLVAAAHHKYYQINEILVHHRVHHENLSRPKTNLLSSITDLKRQITSRQMKYRELWGIKHMYWNKLSLQEQKQLDKAILLTKQAIIGLKTGKISKLLPLLYTYNPMLNYLLAVRNMSALLYAKLFAG